MIFYSIDTFAHEWRLVEGCVYRITRFVSLEVDLPLHASCIVLLADYAGSFFCYLANVKSSRFWSAIIIIRWSIHVDGSSGRVEGITYWALHTCCLSAHNLNFRCCFSLRGDEMGSRMAYNLCRPSLHLFSLFQLMYFYSTGLWSFHSAGVGHIRNANKPTLSV